MVPVVVVTDEGSFDFEVDADADATVAALLGALGLTGPLVVDGAQVGSEVPLADVLAAGAVLTTAEAWGRGAAPRPVCTGAGLGRDDHFRLVILSGPGVGMAVGLSVGRHVVGSGPGATVSLRTDGVADRHAVLVVTTDSVHLLTASGARALDGNTVLVIGETVAGVVPAPGAARPAQPGEAGTIVHNRRRRPSPIGPEPALPLPDPPAAEPAPRAMGWATLAIPVLFGMVMAVLVDPRMALFALLGPLVMVGGRVDDARLRRRARRLAVAATASAANTLAANLERRGAAELRRRRAGQPGVAVLAWWVERRSPRVWERRRGDADFLRLTVGYGPARWVPVLAGDPATAPPPVADVLAARSTLSLAPVTVDLDRRRVLGLAGDRAAALDLCRGLVCSAAVLHGPADLAVAVVTDRPADWDWVKWLPHTLAAPTDRRRLLAGDAVDTAAVLDWISRGSGIDEPPRPVLVVVDRGPLTDPQGVAVRRLLAGAVREVAAVVVAAGEHDLPTECTEVMDCGPRHASLTTGEGTAEVRVAGAVATVAAVLARGLARYRDPDQTGAGVGLPRTVRLFELAGGADPSPDQLMRRWEVAGVGVVAVLGSTAAGPLRIDLAADGPHALLAGTTGSGKSELLRTLVASLAMDHHPEHLNFVLVDYKGGSAFDAAVGLPHTVGLVTDLDGGLADRALRCLEAELRHRERELRTLGAPDIERFRGLGGLMPRMLIVVDEFAALARELPRFVGSLVDIAARGRSLGIHLVLATQRPAGVVSDAIRANTGIRIALRVTDRADSTDVLGDPGAAAIGRTLPGRGLVRLGPGELVAFQAATVSTGPAAAGVVTVRPFRFGHDPGEGPDADASTAEDPGPTDLERLAAAASEAATRLGLPPPRRPWPDPLPDRVSTDEISVAETGQGVVVGLADEPDLQRTVPFTWSPADGNLGLYGAPGSGLTTALETVVLGLAANHAADPVEVYVVDMAGDLARLSRLAPVGAVVSPGEADRIARLVRMLVVTVDRGAVLAVAGAATRRRCWWWTASSPCYVPWTRPTPAPCAKVWCGWSPKVSGWAWSRCSPPRGPPACPR